MFIGLLLVTMQRYLNSNYSFIGYPLSPTILATLAHSTLSYELLDPELDPESESLTSRDDLPFIIDPITAVITIKSALDREKKSEYNLKVIVNM